MTAPQKAAALPAGTPAASPDPAVNSAPLTAPVQGSILAIDYGRKRIGLAVSDEMRLVARPLETLERKNRRDDVKRLREIARAHGARRIVVGHPLRLDGTRGEMAEEVERFAVRLQKQLGLPVVLVDERLTSWQAEQMAGEMRWFEQAAAPGQRKVPSAKGAPGGRGGKTKNGAVAGSRKPTPALDALAAALILRDYLNHECEKI